MLNGPHAPPEAVPGHLRRLPTTAPRGARPRAGRLLAAALLAALLATTLAACRRAAPAPATPTPSGAVTADAPHEGLRARVELDGDPSVGVVPALVYVLDGANGVSDADVTVTGDMTHAGMVPVVRTAAAVSEGLYRADDFEFTMAGDWVLTVDVRLPDGRTTQAETRVTVPSGN